MVSAKSLRRLAGWTLLAAMAAGAGSSHTHSLFAELLTPGAGLAEAPRAVTTHNPLSRAAHCHAILRTIGEDGCVACHVQRTTLPAPVGAPITSFEAQQCLSNRASPWRRSDSPLPKSSRAPPVVVL